MPLPDDFFSDDAHYRIRVCITIESDPTVGIFTGSKVHQCDRCGEPIWVDENMPVPDVEERVDGDVSLCFPCAHFVISEAGDDDASWIPGFGPDDQ